MLKGRMKQWVVRRIKTGMWKRVMRKFLWSLWVETKERSSVKLRTPVSFLPQNFRQFLPIEYSECVRYAFLVFPGPAHSWVLYVLKSQVIHFILFNLEMLQLRVTKTVIQSHATIECRAKRNITQISWSILHIYYLFQDLTKLLSWTSSVSNTQVLNKNTWYYIPCQTQ